jgi:hypothetical protein
MGKRQPKTPKPRGVNPMGELVCCHSCGRDTTARSGYCAACIGRWRVPDGDEPDDFSLEDIRSYCEAKEQNQ